MSVSPTSAVRGRYLALIGCLIAAGASGFIYDFSIYSGALKAKFDFTQADLELIAIGGVFVAPLSPICGWTVDVYGNRVALLLGGVITCTGLVLQYLYTMDLLFVNFANPALLMLLFTCISVLGNCFIIAVAYSQPVRLFPSHRGVVIGIVKASAGVAGGLLAQLYTLTVGTPNDSSATFAFFLLLAGTACLVELILAPILVSKTQQNQDQSNQLNETDFNIRLNRAYVAFLFLVTAVTVSSLLTASSEQQAAIVTAESPGAYILVLSFVLCITGLTSALLIGSTGDGEVDPVDPSSQLTQSLVLQSPSTDSTLSLREVPEVSTGAIIQHMNTWLILISAVGTIGAGLCLTTNSFQIVESSQIPSACAGTAITLFSAAQALGRLAGGLLPDLLGGKPGFTTAMLLRPLSLACYCVCSALGQLLLWLAPVWLPSLGDAGSVALLYLGYGLCGLGFGGTWPQLVTIVSDLYGLKHLSANYMICDATTNTVAGLAFAKYLPNLIYHAHVPEDSNTCLGAACFGMTHLVLSTWNVGAVFTASLLAWRMSKA